MDFFELHSPCIGYCSVSHGDDVCFGCHRTEAEVVGWITMNQEDREDVMHRIYSRRAFIFSRYFSISDERLMLSQARDRQIPLPKNADPMIIAWCLFDKGANFINNLSSYGLTLRLPEYKNVALSVVKEMIEKDVRGLI